MLKSQWLYRAAGAAVLFATIAVPSAFAEKRLPQTTSGEEVTVEARRDGELAPLEGSIQGTITGVRRGGFYLETSRDRRITILTSGSTPVFYRGRRVRLDTLRAGDDVRVKVERSRRGLRAEEVELLGSRRQVSRNNPADAQITGTVVSVNRRLATFTFRGDNRRTITVDAFDSRGERDLFNWLSSGDRVAIYGDFQRSGVFRANRVDRLGRDDREDRDRDDRWDDRRSSRDDDDDEDDEEEEDDEDEDDEDDEEEDEEEN